MQPSIGAMEGYAALITPLNVFLRGYKVSHVTISETEEPGVLVTMLSC